MTTAPSKWDIEQTIGVNNHPTVVKANTNTIPTVSSTTDCWNEDFGQSYYYFVVIALIACAAVLPPTIIAAKNSGQTTATVGGATTTAATAGATTLPSIASTTTVCSNNPTTTATTTVAPGSPVTLWYMTNPCSSTSSYFQVSFYYYAQSSNETLTFGIVNGPADTYLDDVSVLDVTQSSTELLCNGGFENGTCICWSGTCPIYTSPCHTSNYCINNGYTSMTYMYQTFYPAVGDLLYISFYTYWTGSGSQITTSVTITP